jgi:hypothetical protein
MLDVRPATRSAMSRGSSIDGPCGDGPGEIACPQGERPSAADRVDGASRVFVDAAVEPVSKSQTVVNAEQALVIGAVITELPSDLDPKLVDACEAQLIKLAALYEPSRLRWFGEHILDYVAPEIAEAALAAKLERDEVAARRRRTLTITDDGNGSHRLHGRLDTESAAILKAAIDPLCKPIPGTSGERDPRTAEQRRADALVDVCRLALAADSLPDNGGTRPQLNVTARFDVVGKELSTGTLDIGGHVSPTTVRRLACDAMILPAIMGGRGEVLDLGRERRLFTGAVRRAIILRDGGCAFPGCDRPPRWCDVHHYLSWMRGGKTSVCNGILLCTHHHHLIHEPGGWRITIGEDGRFDFIPPVHIDPLQRPRRNTLFHPRT